MKILFICSQNKWWSRTAEEILKNKGLYNVRSAGTKKSARLSLNKKIFDWADISFVIENKHKRIILDKYVNNPEVIPLEIVNDYQFMHEHVT